MANQGRRVVWCAGCGMFIPSPSPYSGICARCGSPIKELKCIRCGHVWKLKDPEHLLRKGPKCCSPYAMYTRVRNGTRRKEEKE